jgi:hypothetical protein
MSKHHRTPWKLFYNDMSKYLYVSQYINQYIGFPRLRGDPNARVLALTISSLTLEKHYYQGR